jgi:hypothetical protein
VRLKPRLIWPLRGLSRKLVQVPQGPRPEPEERGRRYSTGVGGGADKRGLTGAPEEAWGKSEKNFSRTKVREKRSR